MAVTTSSPISDDACLAPSNHFTTSSTIVTEPSENVTIILDDLTAEILQINSQFESGKILKRNF